MPRALVLILVVVIVVAGLLYFFSTQAEEIPTQPIEVDVAGNAQ